MGLYRSTKYTPSVSPFGLPAPSEREPRRLRRSGRLRASPTVGGGNHRVVPFNEVHSLSQPVRAASSLREGAKAAALQREAKSLPYGGRRESWGCTVQRSTLSQSARSGCQLPQRGSQGRFAPAGSRSLFPIHSYLLPTPTQVGAAGRVRELMDW